MLQSIFFSMPLFVCGILSVELALSLLRWQSPARRWLLAWALTATVLYGGHLVFFHRLTAWLPLSDSLYVAANLAVYPLYLIYIYRLTRRRVPRWMVAVLAVPVVAGVVTGVLYGVMDAEETRTFVERYLYEGTTEGLRGVAMTQAVVHTVCKVLFAAGVLTTVGLGIRQIRRYNRLVESLYADTEHKTLEGVHVVLVLLVATSVVSIVANAIGRAWFADSVWLTAIPSAVFSALLFALGWQGLCQMFSIEDIAAEEEEGAATPLQHSGQPAMGLEPSGRTAGVATVLPHGETAAEATKGVLPSAGLPPLPSHLRPRLERLMREERIFTQPDLKLDDLANMLGTNRTYLLRCMKEEMGMSFSEYINRHRIAYARRLHEENPKLLKSEVAQMVGYSSMSSFYRNLHSYDGA